MLDAIEKLLILQDRDRKVTWLRQELTSIPPQRQMLEARLAAAQTSLETSKTKVKHLESDRKRLELDVEAKKQLIERYSLQQFQTKKNEEYRALAHEIETCKAAIREIEDQELGFMEQIEVAQRDVAASNQFASGARGEIERQLATLITREESLRKQAADAAAAREEVGIGIDAGFLNRYERLRKGKGENVIVGVEHAVCGGCHMKLPPQVIVSCKANQEMVVCPNCGRILYYTSDMDITAAE